MCAGLALEIAGTRSALLVGGCRRGPPARSPQVACGGRAPGSHPQARYGSPTHRGDRRPRHRVRRRGRQLRITTDLPSPMAHAARAASRGNRPAGRLATSDPNGDAAPAVSFAHQARPAAERRRLVAGSFIPECLGIGSLVPLLHVAYLAATAACPRRSPSRSATRTASVSPPSARPVLPFSQ